MKNESRTARRQYYTVEFRGMFGAWWRPINPQTGQPWQASREIRAGHDVYALGNFRTGTSTGIITGDLPPFEEWSKNWTGVECGFSTEARALAAIAANKISLANH